MSKSGLILVGCVGLALAVVMLAVPGDLGGVARLGLWVLFVGMLLIKVIATDWDSRGK